jgi:hypothetical protein
LSQTASASRLHSTFKPGLLRQTFDVTDVWFDNGWDVVLLDAEFPEGLALKSKLQAAGLQVFIGPDGNAGEILPLIVLHATNRGKAAVQSRLEAARDLFPDALVCFVTGGMAQTVTSSNFNDARLALSAAGVGFVCDEPGTWSAPVPARHKKLAE